MARKKAIPKQTLDAIPRNSTSNDARPRRPARDHLKCSVLEELWSIWRANPRVPSVKSRRAWAIARNANPRLVDGWFLRRKTCAKKAGQPIPDGTYDLPPDPPIAPKQEPSVEPELEELTVPDLRSDDTLVYLPYGDELNDVEASSDTVLDEDAFVEPERTETSAYKEVPQQLCSKGHRFQPHPRFGEILFLLAVDLLLGISSPDLGAVEDRCGEATSFENSLSPFFVCNQGWGTQSNPTCILCLSAKLTQDEVPHDFGTIFDFGSREDSSIPSPRLDFRPDTLWELSAIPFLFRTPSVVLVSNATNHSSVDDWATVEDELTRLANEGKLDFAFLDAPHLTSMELHD